MDLREQRDQILVRLLAILEARPEVDDPRAAPARVPAAVASRRSIVARAARASSGCSAQGDLLAGKQREQVRDVPVARLGLVVILGPFLIWPCLPICGGGRRLRAASSAREIRASTPEDLARCDHLREQPVDDLVVHRRAHAQDADLPVGQPIAFSGETEGPLTRRPLASATR